MRMEHDDLMKLVPGESLTKFAQDLAWRCWMTNFSNVLGAIGMIVFWRENWEWAAQHPEIYL